MQNARVNIDIQIPPHDGDSCLKQDGGFTPGRMAAPTLDKMAAPIPDKMAAPIPDKMAAPTPGKMAASIPDKMAAPIPDKMADISPVHQHLIQPSCPTFQGIV
jgi:hypothetical protein